MKTSYAASAAGSGGAAADEVGAFLGHHQHAGIDVRGDEIGHRRGVADAQAFDAVHLEIGIEHAVGRDRAGAKPGGAR